jgi:hypothetical protein
MAGKIDTLRRSLAGTERYVNDHDYICECRPVDVRLALATIDHFWHWRRSITCRLASAN